MKINVILRNGVFVPCYEEDYEKAKKLQKGIMLTCTIRLQRNARLNRKYHLLIKRAWDCLNEQQTAFFGTITAFRKSLEVTAGYYEPVYSVHDKEWQKANKSTSFSEMKEEEFEQLYSDVLDVIYKLLTNKTLSDKEFEAIFEGF